MKTRSQSFKSCAVEKQKQNIADVSQIFQVPLPMPCVKCAETKLPIYAVEYFLRRISNTKQPQFYNVRVF